MASARRRKESARSIGEKLFLLFKKILRKITKYTYWTKEYLILEAPLQGLDHPLPDGYSLMSSDDPLFLSQVMGQVRDGRKLWEKRCEQELFCQALLRQGKLIGWAWFATTDYFEPEDRFTFHLKSHQIYYFHLFIHPEERAGFLAVQAVRKMQNRFIEKGYTHVLCCVNTKLPRNLHFHRALKFEETGRKIRVRYFFTWPVSTVETYSERFLKPRREF